MAIPEFPMYNKTIPVTFINSFGNTIETGAMSAGEITYDGTTYTYSSVRITARPKNVSGTTAIPVKYDVGSTGTSWTSTAYVNGMVVADSGWKANFVLNSGKLTGTFSFKSMSHPDSIKFNVTAAYETKTGISFATTSSPRSDYADQPTITGNRNSPLPGDSGGNTSVKLKVKHYYKCYEWTCGSSTCGWGETISATYNSGASHIVLTGRLGRYDSKLESYLNTLPEPSAPKQEITDNVTLQDTTSSTPRTETVQVTRTKQYEFRNWNTKADGTGTTYGDGGKSLSSNGFTSDTTLYAQWDDRTSATYTLPSDWTTDKLVKNKSEPSDVATVICYDRNIAFESFTCNQYEYKQMKLDGWKGTDGSTIAPGEFIGGSSTYTAVFVKDSNSTSTYTWEENEYTPIVPPDRSGWTYLGLDTDATKKVPTYLPRQKLTVSSSMNLYAIWKANGSGHLFDGTSYKMYQIYIWDGTNWKLYLPKIYNGSDWDTVYM